MLCVRDAEMLIKAQFKKRNWSSSKNGKEVYNTNFFNLIMVYLNKVSENDLKD